MEYLVYLGFREEPQNLSGYLARKGFARDEMYEEPGEKLYKSRNGELFWYIENAEYMGIERDVGKNWLKIAPGITIVSEAEVRLSGDFVENEQDLEKLLKLARGFRDELNTLLTVMETFKPETRRLILE